MLLWPKIDCIQVQKLKPFFEFNFYVMSISFGNTTIKGIKMNLIFAMKPWPFPAKDI